MQPGRRNICFYSNKCQWSKAFIQEIAQTPWKGEFEYICVDPSPSRPALPSWLKKVPTLVIAEDKESPVKTDSDVMNWIYERKLREGGQRASGGNPASLGGGEPGGWSLMEQGNLRGGLSYSGVDVDTNPQGEGGMSMPGSFEFLAGGAAPGDRSMQQYPGAGDIKKSTGRTKKEELFDAQMEAYQRERDAGMPRGPARS